MKIHTLIVTGLSVICVLVAPAHAQQTRQGLGIYTCSQVFTAVETMSEAESVELFANLLSWMQGYMTGKNLEHPPAQQRDLSSMDATNLAELILPYCEANIFANFGQVADAIYLTLPYVSAGV